MNTEQQHEAVTSFLNRQAPHGLSGSVVKNQPTMPETQEAQIGSLGQEDPLEEGIATHSSILPGESPQTEQPDGLQSWDRKESDKNEVTERKHTVFSRMYT